MSSGDAFEREILEHDRLLADRGLAIWLGGEPTFTQRLTMDPAWMGSALGSDKEARARGLVRDLRTAMGGLIVRTLGRKYPGELRHRWSYGLYMRRDPAAPPLWTGPRDPLEIPVTEVTSLPGDSDALCRQLRDAVEERLRRRGSWTWKLDRQGPCPLRLIYRADGTAPGRAQETDPLFSRETIHREWLDEETPEDPLADEGTYVLCFGPQLEEGNSSPAGPCPASLRIELPRFGSVPSFHLFLEDLGSAATALRLPHLVLAGFPPPTDLSVAFTTVTPDPGVIEINMAPAAEVGTYLDWNRRIATTAARHGLAPLRLWYNGETADSGGGGHLTFGGPTPQESPFFVHPHLLPRLIVYLNQHPSLSYLYAVDSLGSSSQCPRPDEGVRECFEELRLALRLLSRLEAPDPLTLHESLAPFLVDRCGNSHRTEANVEKLWNHGLPERGLLGLVELRALRMSRSPERAASIAVLFRSILAHLTSSAWPLELIDWGAPLHDTFGLPFYLERDLHSVLEDLTESGFEIGPLVREDLLREDARVIGSVEVDGFRFTVRRAIEFWLLMGDLSSQEHSTARWLDSSGRRIELVVRPLPGQERRLIDWKLRVMGHEVDLPLTEDATGPAAVLGLRYRAFKPSGGLHPTMEPVECLNLDLVDGGSGGRAHRLSLHGWKPAGGVYPSLPTDEEDAARRRRERFVVTEVTEPLAPAPPPPAGALTPCCLDLRALGPR